MSAYAWYNEHASSYVWYDQYMNAYAWYDYVCIFVCSQSRAYVWYAYWYVCTIMLEVYAMCAY